MDPRFPPSLTTHIYTVTQITSTHAAIVASILLLAMRKRVLWGISCQNLNLYICGVNDFTVQPSDSQTEATQLMQHHLTFPLYPRKLRLHGASFFS